MALDLFKDTLPQAQTNTCQSYAMVLALAAEGGHEIANFDELRAAEAEFRGLAEGFPGGPYGHEALQQAVEAYTGGKYELRIESYPDIVEWMTRVSELTRLESTADLLIAQVTGQHFPVVLTSVTRFDQSTYGTGHIMAVLGVAGSGLNSSTEIIAFNSAIKGGGAVNQCEAGTQPGDLRYTAGVVSTNNFELKDYPGFRVLVLEEN